MFPSLPKLPALQSLRRRPALIELDPQGDGGSTGGTGGNPGGFGTGGVLIGNGGGGFGGQAPYSSQEPIRDGSTGGTSIPSKVASMLGIPEINWGRIAAFLLGLLLIAGGIYLISTGKNVTTVIRDTAGRAKDAVKTATATTAEAAA